MTSSTVKFTAGFTLLWHVADLFTVPGFKLPKPNEPPAGHGVNVVLIKVFTETSALVVPVEGAIARFRVEIKNAVNRMPKSKGAAYFIKAVCETYL